MIQRESESPLWTAVKNEIASRITEHQYLTWFERLRFDFAGPSRVAIQVPNHFYQTFLEHRYLPVIQESIESVTDLQHPTIEFQVDTEAEELPPLGEPMTAAVRTTEVTPSDGDHIPINRNYTFDQFVVGPSNRLAHAAAQASSESPGFYYNPLFVFGPVGLGKTHLLQAVANCLVEKGMKRLIYVSCASFTNDFIAAIGKNDFGSFRRKYREADALLIDDIHFLADKERTQEEFFHTFNEIYNQQKQIVLSSDSSPQEIKGLSDRLESRFKLGLVAEISRPSFETRVAILVRKARNLGLELPTEIAEYVAHRIRDNVREIEGAILRLHSMVTIENRSLQRESVQACLSDLLGSGARRVDLMQIQQEVLEKFDVRPSDLHSRKRTRSVVIPRQICMYLARTHTDLSLGEIGLYFGGRDHSTVLHAVEKVKGLQSQDARIRSAISSIEQRLGLI